MGPVTIQTLDWNQDNMSKAESLGQRPSRTAVWSGLRRGGNTWTARRTKREPRQSLFSRIQADGTLASFIATQLFPLAHLSVLPWRWWTPLSFDLEDLRRSCTQSSGVTNTATTGTMVQSTATLHALETLFCHACRFFRGWVAALLRLMMAPYLAGPCRLVRGCSCQGSCCDRQRFL